MKVTVTQDRLVIGGRRHAQGPLLLRVRGRDYRIDPGATRMVPLDRTEPASG